VELRWSSGDASRTSDDPDIFTAVREQLALQLKPETGRVEMVVIERVEVPTPD
jgi:uncharacterized protein (TIGR03435 family)